MGEPETLILCGIKPATVLERYYAGAYDSIEPKRPSVAPHRVEMVPQHDTSATISDVAVEAVYDTHRSGRGSVGGVYRVYTSNHALYEAALNSKPPDLRGLRCYWCHGLVSTDEGNAWPALLVTRYWRRNEAHYFEGEGMYCDTRCAETHRINLAESHIRSGRYRDAGPIMRMYHSLVAPESVALTPRPHWSLLREYGGPLTRDDYKGISTPVLSLPNVVQLPTKYEYETKIA